MYRNLGSSWSFAPRTCTGCQQSKNVLDKYWQCCCCLFICTPPVFLLYRGFAESDQIWRGMIGLIWKIDSLSSSATSRAKGRCLSSENISLFFTFLLISSFLACIFFFACILGGLAIKLIDIYCGYFLVSSLSLTEEKSAINFS